MSFLLRSISLFSLFQADMLDSSWQASVRLSSSPQILVWQPWSLASELSSLHRFLSRTRLTTSTKVRLPVIGAKNRSRRVPFLCHVASRVCGASPSPSATMSRWCSQVAIWRVFPLSTTLTSLDLWNAPPPM